MRVGKIVKEEGLEDDDYMIVDPENPVPNPHLGPLERRVSTTFEEGLEQEEMDLEAMSYWFTEPPEGWKSGKRRLKKAKTIPTEEFDEVRHVGDAARERRPLAEVRPGDVLQGTVVKQMLHHGIQVDVGAEADGLIPLTELEQWRALGAKATPEIDDIIEVVVYAVRPEPIYRFPLQLVPADPELAARMPAPEEHVPPLDLREVTLSQYGAVAELTGRKWAPVKVIVPPAREQESTWMEIEYTEEEMLRFDDIAAGL